MLISSLEIVPVTAMKLRRRSNSEIVTIEERLPVFATRDASFLRVNGHADLLANVFRNSRDIPPRKLAIMLANPPSGFGKSAHNTRIAWPTDILYSLSSTEVSGYLVPVFEGRYTLSDAIDPKRRQFRLPNTSTRDLYDICINLSKSIHSLHEAGYVIGELSPEAVILNGIGTTLINCDRYQTEGAGYVHNNTAETNDADGSKPEKDPSGHDVGIVSGDHDNYALASIIFKTITATANDAVESSYTVSRSTDVSIEYNLTAASALVAAELINVFRHAFDVVNVCERPTARQWQNALTVAKDSLACCEYDPLHWFPTTTPACPWCERLPAGRVSPRAFAPAATYAVDAVPIKADYAASPRVIKPVNFARTASVFIGAAISLSLLVTILINTADKAIQGKILVAEKLRMAADRMSADSDQAATDLARSYQLAAAAAKSSSHGPFGFNEVHANRTAIGEKARVTIDLAALSQAVSVEHLLHAISLQVVNYSRTRLTDRQANVIKAELAYKCRTARENALEIVSEEPYSALAWSDVIRADELAADPQSEESDEQTARKYVQLSN